MTFDERSLDLMILEKQRNGVNFFCSNVTQPVLKRLKPSTFASKEITSNFKNYRILLFFH